MHNNTELILSAFKALMDDTKAMVFVKNAELIYVAASAPFVKMVGKNSADEIIGCTDYQIFSDKNLAERYIMDDHKLIRGGHNLIEYTEPITDENGKARYGSTSKYILRNSSGEFIGLLGITRDITKEYEAFQRYQREIKYLFELPKDSYAVSYIDVEDWRIISQRRHDIDNATFQACYSVEELCQAAIESIVDKDSEAVGFYDNFMSDNLKRIYESGRESITFEYERKMSDNSIRWVYNEVKFIVDAETGHLCVMLTAKDIKGNGTHIGCPNGQNDNAV